MKLSAVIAPLAFPMNFPHDIDALSMTLDFSGALVNLTLKPKSELCHFFDYLRF